MKSKKERKKERGDLRSLQTTRRLLEFEVKNGSKGDNLKQDDDDEDDFVANDVKIHRPHDSVALRNLFIDHVKLLTDISIRQ